MSLRQGMTHVMSAAERVKSPAGGLGTINFLYWAGGETKVIRFLTDANEIFVTKVHERVADKTGKKRTFLCKQELGEKCPLCDSSLRPREMGYALAVLREELFTEENGRKVISGYKDFTHEIEAEENGKKIKKKAPYVGIVNQAPSNFWLYINAVYEKYGSLKDFDIEIKRQGSDTKTQYIPFPGPVLKIENMDERYKKFVPDLEGYLKYLGSDTYYSKHLDFTPTKAVVEEVVESESEDELETEFDRLKAKQTQLSSVEEDSYN